MGNKPINKYTDIYCNITEVEIGELRKKNKVVDVFWLEPEIIKLQMEKDEYFQEKPKQKDSINNMLAYYKNHRDYPIYKQTEYLCDVQNRICICNIHAEELRNLYGQKEYKDTNKFISWITKKY
jgi:hypothetical protein